MGNAPPPEDLKVRSGLPCRRGDERGTLRHTWLERRLLYELKMDRDAWLSAGPTHPLPEVLAGIPWQLKKLTSVLERMVEEHSPAQLVDRGPLARLPDATKELLRKSLHDAYLASGVIQFYQDGLRRATEQFSLVAAEAETVWREGDRSIKAQFLNNLEAAATHLSDALALPQGVVLP